MADISDNASAELEEVAKGHPSFESFLQDLERVADRIWHKVRSNGDQAKLEDESSEDTDETTDSDHRSAESLGVKPSRSKAQAAPPATPGSPSVPGSPASASDPA